MAALHNLTGATVHLVCKDPFYLHSVVETFVGDPKRRAVVKKQQGKPLRMVGSAPVYPADQETSFSDTVIEMPDDIPAGADILVSNEVAQAIRDGAKCPPGSYLTTMDHVACHLVRSYTFKYAELDTFCFAFKKVVE